MNESIDFGRPFQFVFEDKDWLKKLLLGAVMFFIPIVGPMFLMGYQKRIANNVMAGKDLPLPEWDRWGEDIGDGFKMFVIYLVWILPGLIVRMLGMIPLLLASAGGDYGHGNAMAGAAGGLFFASLCLGTLLLLAGAIFGGLGVLNYIATGELGAGFQLGEMIRLLKDNLVNILLGAVIMLICQMVAAFGLVACFVGVFLTATWSTMAKGHVGGQVLRIDRARRGAVGSPVLQPSH